MNRHVWIAAGWAMTAVLSMGSGAETAQATGNAGGGEAVRLVYVEQEPGLPPYRSRYIVTGEYLRIDDGVDTGDFVLFDRTKGVIYSASSDNRSILQIHERDAVAEPPEALEVTADRQSLEGAPDVGGLEAELRRYAVNGRECFNQVSVPGLAPEVVAALVEYRAVLAGEHRRMVPLTPADQQDACDLARHAFEYQRFMAHGLPLREWDTRGNRRELIELELDYQPAAGLFELPAGYRTLSMPGASDG